MNKQEKQIFTSDNLKETAIMTIAVGIIAAAVYFFLIPSMTSISSISALAIVIVSLLTAAPSKEICEEFDSVGR